MGCFEWVGGCRRTQFLTVVYIVFVANPKLCTIKAETRNTELAYWTSIYPRQSGSMRNRAGCHNISQKLSESINKSPCQSVDLSQGNKLSQAKDFACFGLPIQRQRIGRIVWRILQQSVSKTFVTEKWNTLFKPQPTIPKEILNIVPTDCKMLRIDRWK